MSRLVGGIVACLIVAGCSASETSDAVEPTTTQPPSTVALETTSTTALSPGDTVPFEDIPPLALYLAAIDRGLEGTEYEGDVYLDPDSYVNVGRLFCSLLEADVTPTGVLESYITALESEPGELSDDDLVLGGVILGASVQLICPEYIEALEEVTGE